MGKHWPMLRCSSYILILVSLSQGNVPSRYYGHFVNHCSNIVEDQGGSRVQPWR